MESTVGNYKYYNKVIGRGSSSIVYKGIGLLTGEKVAIKQIYCKGLRPIEMEHLRTEIEIMKKVNHKNIIRLVDVINNQDDNIIYIITEFCDKGTLQDILIDQDLNESKIQTYIRQIAEGLRYLQSFNVVHRDLKLSNILLTKDNTIKIADFGFAKETNNNEELMKTLCGTPGFMAPEILFRYKYGSKSDLWSLGMILYHLIYKSHPYDPVSNMIELTHKIRNVKITYPYRRDVSDSCLSLMKALLIVNPVRRITWDDFYRHPWIGLDDSEKMAFKLDDSELLNLSIDIKENSQLSENESEKSNIIDSDLSVGDSLNMEGKSHQIFENYIPTTKYKNINSKPVDIPVKGRSQAASLYDFVSLPVVFLKKSFDYFNSI